MRKLTAILTTVREAFGEEADEMKEDLMKRGQDKLMQIVELAKDEVKSTSRAMMTAETQEHISRMMVKGYSIATELSMQSFFKSRIKDVLGKGLSDEGLYIVGKSLECMAGGTLLREKGLKGGDEAAETARAIIEEFPEFKNVNTRLFNKKAQGVRYVGLAPALLENTLRETKL